jgi:hypothetical protein
MKRFNLIFLLYILFAGQQAYGQWDFGYMCGISNPQRQGGYATKQQCESAAAAMKGRPCDNGSGGFWGSSIILLENASKGGYCFGNDLPVANANNNNTGQITLGTADFTNLQQGKGIVSGNPFDKMIDGTEEYLYWDQAMFGETQNTFTAQTGDKAFDEAYLKVLPWGSVHGINMGNYESGGGVSVSPKIFPKPPLPPKEDDSEWTEKQFQDWLANYQSKEKNPEKIRPLSQSLINFGLETISFAGLALSAGEAILLGSSMSLWKEVANACYNPMDYMGLDGTKKIFTNAWLNVGTAVDIALGATSSKVVGKVIKNTNVVNFLDKGGEKIGEAISIYNYGKAGYEYTDDINKRFNDTHKSN